MLAFAFYDVNIAEIVAARIGRLHQRKRQHKHQHQHQHLLPKLWHLHLQRGSRKAVPFLFSFCQSILQRKTIHATVFSRRAIVHTAQSQSLLASLCR